MIKKPVRSILNKIFHSDFRHQYVEIKASNTREKMLSFRDQHLKKLLLHAYHNVPYYKEIFRDIGIIHNNNEVDLSKYGEIPIIDKNIIREQGKNLISKDYTSRKWYYNSSGGSTGEPLRFIQDDQYRRWANAVSYYWYKDVIGIEEPSKKKVVLWGSERDLIQGGMGWIAKIVNWSTNTVFLNSFKMTSVDKSRYLNVINSYKPVLIRGYAGSLFELCQHAEGKGMRMHTPEAVVSSAEVLNIDMREKIENVFGTKVYDFYGSRESNNLAGECSEGLMHVLVFHNYIEVLNDCDRPAKEGEENRVIVTNLHNYSMPFIRYEIGDTVVPGPDVCKCGNPLPTLKKITGRITDHFVNENGTVIHGEYFTHLFYLRDWVESFQVIQEDYHRIGISLILRDNPNEYEMKDIENNIKLVMGQDCQIRWDFVDEITKTSQGKHLYTRSLLR